jgi:hypothetical protein
VRDERVEFTLGRDDQVHECLLRRLGAAGRLVTAD